MFLTCKFVIMNTNPIPSIKFPSVRPSVRMFAIGPYFRAALIFAALMAWKRLVSLLFNFELPIPNPDYFKT
jgi:hypothetical protein